MMRAMRSYRYVSTFACLDCGRVGRTFDSSEMVNMVDRFDVMQ
jgi:hypothetical protein